MGTIKEAIQKLANSGKQPSLLIGQVVKFDENNFTATIKLSFGLQTDEVRTRAVINSEASGIFITPKTNSSVLVSLIDGKLESMVVLVWSEIEKFHIQAPLTTLNGDQHGGLVKSKAVTDEIKEIKDEINKLRNLLISWVPVPSDGGASLKTLISSSWSQPIVPKNQSYFENEKVKHG